MRSLDETSINEYGIPGSVLMENAGVSVVNEILRLQCDKSAVVICGTGNNGGDGFVIARHLINKKWRVEVFICGDAGKIKGEALSNLQILVKMDADIKLVSSNEPDVLKEGLGRGSVIVDALLGTGFKGEVSSVYKNIIDMINESGKCIISVDMPSGLDGDGGFASGACVKAHKTVTFQMAKIGQLINDGPEYCGELIIADISIPYKAIEEAKLSVSLTDDAFLKARLKARTNNTHKGTYGRVLAAAGSLGMLGAGLLASKAALRSGAGTVVLGVPQSLQAEANAQSLEIMVSGLYDKASGVLSKDCTVKLIEMANSSECLVFGPGLSQDEDIKVIAGELIKKIKVPMVIDADGLNAISNNAELLKEALNQIVITPHPGEMARLMQCSTSEIQKNRLQYAMKFAEEHGVVTVLKGFRTIIALPTGEAYVTPTGNPGMATAGAGDVLAGIIAGLIAQGMAPADAAVCGAYIHGAAGDAAAEKNGQHGLTASDIIAFVPHTIKSIAGR